MNSRHRMEAFSATSSQTGSIRPGISYVMTFPGPECTRSELKKMLRCGRTCRVALPPETVRAAQPTARGKICHSFLAIYERCSASTRFDGRGSNRFGAKARGWDLVSHFQVARPRRIDSVERHPPSAHGVRSSAKGAQARQRASGSNNGWSLSSEASRLRWAVA